MAPNTLQGCLFFFFPLIMMFINLLTCIDSALLVKFPKLQQIKHAFSSVKVGTYWDDKAYGPTIFRVPAAVNMKSGCSNKLISKSKSQKERKGLHCLQKIWVTFHPFCFFISLTYLPLLWAKPLLFFNILPKPNTRPN